MPQAPQTYQLLVARFLMTGNEFTSHVNSIKAITAVRVILFAENRNAHHCRGEVPSRQIMSFRARLLDGQDAIGASLYQRSQHRVFESLACGQRTNVAAPRSGAARRRASAGPFLAQRPKGRAWHEPNRPPGTSFFCKAGLNPSP